MSGAKVVCAALLPSALLSAALSLSSSGFSAACVGGEVGEGLLDSCWVCEGLGAWELCVVCCSLERCPLGQFLQLPLMDAQFLQYRLACLHGQALVLVLSVVLVQVFVLEQSQHGSGLSVGGVLVWVGLWDPWVLAPLLLFLLLLFVGL